MINLDFLHPYPRYGVAAALVALSEDYELSDLTNLKTIASFAAEAIERAMNSYTLYTANNPLDLATTILKFDYLDNKKVEPGQKSGQTAGNGYYLAPHIITNDKSSANTVIEAREIRKILLNASEEDLLKPQQKLKRSFAPLTSKINNGKTSMAEPKANLIEAAFTVIATLTRYKPAAYIPNKKGNWLNATIVPDLPLISNDSTPLIDFVRLFADLQRQAETDLRENTSILHSAIDLNNRKYKRPPIFRGNYPNAPRDSSLGAVSLVAAIGSWAKGIEPFLGDSRATFAKRVLELMANQPLYVVSYEEFHQESYGHHLVQLALTQNLPALVRSAHHAVLFGVDKIDDPKNKLYKLFFDRFLQQFSQATFRDFLATRAEYPNDLSPLIEQYMATEHEFSTEFIKSARAYGQSLNLAAFIAAKKEETEDLKNGRKPKPIQELKNRILVQFESTISSTKSPTALLSQMGIIAGRLTGSEINSEAALFMETVATWNPSDKNTSLVKELVTAFMRLNSRKAHNADKTESLGQEPENSSEESPLNDPMLQTDN